ncbi:type II toxin-antitoxin system VapC family toxin [Segnochrobactrum spirostomi]|uniref:Type II toxin-antitoxin system VapC family toxin n=1 Tax=Segnochrobactrum spirostomi TaxID=2608987 RepID=A0A6A7Y999_9HYPH|nr:type II toxin-antitoxin system VapC family toxin [Segnochrobactrum spirostomi]MQT14222.1 type II toxin-antitoxin system VapC family toxin [Segnochrobactrum spirostomi]
MKITADTNVLLRIVVPGDEKQQAVAIDTLKTADSVAISTHSLCELAWVMERRYEASRTDIAAAIRLFMKTRNVVLNRPAVEAGLEMLEAGGDFADGVVAFDGQWLGGETFVSFDRKAVKLLGEQGIPALLLK